MERANVDGITLEYEASGRGDSVVLIHGVLIADALRPLLDEPSLVGRYQLINYHRRGYVGSSPNRARDSIARQAADCRALLAHLNVERAHVVGHSFGGAIALQLTLDTPKLVHSLALLEPALMIGASAAGYREALERGRQHFREADEAVVVDEFLQARWPGYCDPLDQLLPGAFAQGVTDAKTTFEMEFPALLAWSVGEAELRRITQPVLSVLGGASDALAPRFGEAHRLLLEWLPHAEGFVLPGTTHFLQMENPHGTAEALAAFFARNPLPPRSLDTPEQG